jgi:hypothetical protein
MTASPRKRVRERIQVLRLDPDSLCGRCHCSVPAASARIVENPHRIRGCITHVERRSVDWNRTVRTDFPAQVDEP